MATITSTVFVGSAHPNHNGINPTHLIMLSENTRPSYQLYNLINMNHEITLIPTVENMLDDLFLLISTYIQKYFPEIDRTKIEKKESLYEIFDKGERAELYKQSQIFLKKSNLKVVMNLLEGSHLLKQLDNFSNYEIDFEVTTTSKKSEFNAWSNKVEKK